MKLQADNNNGVYQVSDFDYEVDVCDMENFYHQLPTNPDNNILATEVDGNDKYHKEMLDDIIDNYGIKFK